MIAQEGVTDERHHVDESVGDDQRPEFPGALPVPAEHEPPHDHVSDAATEPPLIEVVTAAQE